MSVSIVIGGESIPATHSPEGITLNPQGCLSLVEIESFPSNVTLIQGSLNIHDSPIRELPSPLTVHGDLLLESCPNIQLPDNLVVTGDLILSNSEMKSDLLPRGLIVSGALHISDCNIRELPNDIKVGRSIVMNGSKVKSLPDEIILPGVLILGTPQYRNYPEHSS